MQPKPGDKSGRNPRIVLRGSDSQERSGSDAFKSSDNAGFVGVHWFRGSIKRERFSEVITLIEAFFGKPEYQRFGRYCYDCRVFWASEVSLFYCADSKKTDSLLDGRICLDVSGSALDKLSPEELDNLLVLLNGMGFRASRFDVYYDDVNRLITPCSINEWIVSQERQGFSPVGHFQIRSPVQVYKNGGLIHDELTFGRRGNKGSGCYARIYDKALESDGDNKSIRYEIEFSDEKSDKAFKYVSGSDIKDLTTALGALVGGAIDFYLDRSSEKNLSRLSRPEWWETILSGLGWYPVRVARAGESIQKKKQWIEDQVRATLTTLSKVARRKNDFVDWLMELVADDGILKPHHKAMIEEYKKSDDYKRSDGFRIFDMMRYLSDRGKSATIIGGFQ